MEEGWSVEGRFSKFLENSYNRFGDKFDYIESEYIDAKTHIIIRCKEHDFKFNQTPDKHLQSTHACPICLKENKKHTKATIFKSCKPFEHYNKMLTEKYNTEFKPKSG